MINAGLIAHKLATQDPGLIPTGKLYVRIAPKLTPSVNLKLIAIAGDLFRQERRSPSVSSLQLQLRATTVTSSIFGTGPLGENIAAAAVLIIMMMVNDGDGDLQQQMDNAYSQTQEKQALRALLNSRDTNMAELNENFKSASVNIWALALPGFICDALVKSSAIALRDK